MQVRKVAGALGAEISGVDLSRGVSAALAQDLRGAFLEHQVIFLRDQDLTPAQFLAFAQAMGEPVEYPFVKGIDGFAHIIEVKKLEHERVNFGGIWHSDTTYLDEPPMGSMLLAREIPPYGGDTLFASQYAAYDALSDTMKRMLEGLKGISSSAKADVSKTREDRIKSDGKDSAPKEYRVAHPVVRTHPETRRKALYVNIAHTCGIEGLSDEELATRRAASDVSIQNREMMDEDYASRIPDLTKIKAPVLSAGNWGGVGLHPRGNFEGYLRAGSEQKWLEVHGDTHFSHFYSNYGLALQKRFFGHFLKGENNGWTSRNQGAGRVSE